MAGKMTALQGEAHFFEESMNPGKVKEYLGRPKDVDKLKGMKWLLAMVSKGRDVSEFFSDVVKNMAVKSVEVKKMVYIYLVHYADHNAQCRELALLSINSFQNDLRGSNQLIKALALRVMTSIRVPDIIQIQLLAVRDCASDGSPYVRKCAANAIPKIFVLDPDQGPQLCQVMEQLLKDSNTMVLGSVVAAFMEVCPNKFELLHPVYRKLCHLLADVDEWGQMAILTALQRYLRTQFTSPHPGSSSGAGGKVEQESNQPSAKVKRRVVKRAFYSSEEDESTEEEMDEREATATTPEVGSVFTTSDADLGSDLDPDHRLLLRCSLPLLKSRNSGVVLAVCTTHYYCGSRTSSTMTQVAKAMVRILRNRREIQFIVLDSIRTMASENPAIFRPFLQEFFVKASDPLFTSTLKLDVLTQLATKENCSSILGELQTYVLHRDKSFVCAAVRAVGRVADARPEVAEQCIQGLLTLVTCSKTSVVVAEAVVVLRQLLQQNPGFEGSEAVVRRLAALLLRSFTHDPEGDGARQAEHEQSSSGAASTGVAMASLAQPAARASIVWTLSEYHWHVSYIASDILRVLAKAFSELDVEVKMQVLNFAVKLALRCPDDKRVQSLASFVLEMARFDLSHDLRDRARFMTAMLGLATADQGVDGAALLALNAKAGQVLLKRRSAPTVKAGDGQDTPAKSKLVLGTLSAIMGHRINGYLPLPDWVSVQPDGSAREPPKEEPRGLSGASRSFGADQKGNSSASGFYSGTSSSPDYSSGSGSESESYDSSSGSDSSSESTSVSMSGSESDSESTDDDSGSSEGTRSRSSSETGSSTENDVSSTSGGEEGVGLLIMGPGATNSGPTYGASAPAPQSQDLTGLVERMAVADREENSSSQQGGRLNDLNSLNLTEIKKSSSFGSTGNIPSVPVVGPRTDATLRSTGSVIGRISPDADTNMTLSLPSTLLRHQAGGGLQVDYRYTRGRPNPMSRPTTVLTLRLTLTNHRTTPIRRIRAVPPRDGTPMEAFTEVQVLPAGGSIETNLEIDFGGRPKEVRFELKTDKGSFMVSVEPPPEELMFPQTLSKPDFQRALGSMRQLEQASVECQVSPEDISRIPARTLRAVNVSMVLHDSDEGREYWWFSACSMAGSMAERVFIKVSAMNEAGMVIVDVYSDHPSLPSKLTVAVKRALERHGR